MHVFLCVCDSPPEVQLEALALLLALEAGSPRPKVMTQGHLVAEERRGEERRGEEVR